MAIALALVSAITYGVSDYVGGRASRRVPAVAVALFAEVVMLVICLVAVPLIESSPPTGRAALWGAVAGTTGSIAVVGLYVALARGNMTVVAPVTGVVAAVVPVVVGVTLGERPGAVAVVGIVLALVAVGLVGGAAGAFASKVPRLAVDPRSVALAVAVGVGFGLLFVAYSRTGDSGMWPLLFARFGALPVLSVTYAVQQRGAGMMDGRGIALAGVVVGLLIVIANGSYLASTREGLLSVVAVVVSMYPASTVALAAVLDGERASRSQIVGMGLAVAALAMITATS